MKKLVLSLAVIFAVGMVSCGDNKSKECEDSAACDTTTAVAPAEEGTTEENAVVTDSTQVEEVAVETPDSVKA